MSTEALKLALEALEAHADIGIKSDKAITAIKQALAAPVQEPVETYIHEYTSKPHPGDFGIPKGHWWQAKQYADALHTTPPAAQREWVGLTDEEIQNCYREAYKTVQGRQLEILFARTIEAKLKEKNNGH